MIRANALETLGVAWVTYAHGYRGLTNLKALVQGLIRTLIAPVLTWPHLDKNPPLCEPDSQIIVAARYVRNASFVSWVSW
ncbi:hypothetical protein RSAG8_09367, partial [Rhizoctonia solani AG-8 WAC10335]